jgi:hypothetical protein
MVGRALDLIGASANRQHLAAHDARDLRVHAADVPPDHTTIGGRVEA